MFAGL